MLAAIVSWLHWGVDSQNNHTLKRKTLHTNIAALVTVVSMLNFFGVAWSIGNPLMLKVVLLQIPALFIAVFIPWLNRRESYNFARWALVCSVVGSQLTAILMGFGSHLYVHYYFVLFALVPVLFFPMSQWLPIIGLFLVNTSLFLYFELHRYPAAPEILQLNAQVIQTLRSGYVGSTFLTMLFFVWLVELIAEQNEHRLAELSVTDVLTGLPNRRFFEDSFRREIVKAHRKQGLLALAMLDIDWFKHVNDTYGHEVGDQVLRHVAQQIRHAVRHCDMVARVGGEEFAVLLPETTQGGAAEVAERIRAQVASHPYWHGQQTLPITVSIGVTAVATHQPTEYSYKLADDALYVAKQRGRNQVVSSALAV